MNRPKTAAVDITITKDLSCLLAADLTMTNELSYLLIHNKNGMS